jgi:hypothetical protein
MRESLDNSLPVSGFRSGKPVVFFLSTVLFFEDLLYFFEEPCSGRGFRSAAPTLLILITKDGMPVLNMIVMQASGLRVRLWWRTR